MPNETPINVSNRRPKKPFQLNKLFICFCFGFTWSTILGLAAFLLCQLYLFSNEPIQFIDKCEKRIIGTYRLSDRREITEGHLSKLTHLNFASVYYKENGNIGFSFFEEQRRLEKANEKAKKFKVKTMFTLEILGGNSKNISGLMEDSMMRTKLVQSISTFIQKHDLDGINLNWEAPLSEKVQIFVQTLCKEIREELNKLQFSMNREESYILSLVCQRKVLRLDYDEIFKYVNFLNIETDNYYAHWLQFPSNTLIGPPTPIYSGHGIHSLNNLDATMEYFSCVTKRPNQLNIMTVFGGRLWKNVISSEKSLWMRANSNGNIVEGEATEWRDYSKVFASWNKESKTPYIWNPTEKTYHAFENKRSYEEKVKYAVEKNIGGISIGSITADDDNQSLLNIVASDSFCSEKSSKKVNFDCGLI